MIDLIGDVHGHADKLEALLIKLGYAKKNNVFSHSERKVLFVGDYIDRGPQIKETLEIVKSMVDNGNAIALMGNHEYNALCFHYKNADGGHLREHKITNIIQHFETLKQFHNNQKEYENYVEWFKTLPLFYESDNFRAVHACWDENNINFLKNKLDNGLLTEELIYESVNKGTEFNDVIEETLKGKEIKLPKGLDFIDKDGTKRYEIRIKWWENPAEMTYKSISVEPIENIPENPIDINTLKNKDYYQDYHKKVFFGHYWLKGEPIIYKDNVCCLDYSVAKGGKLVAYRLNEETNLDNGNLVFV
jgi:hypothetical protein